MPHRNRPRPFAWIIWGVAAVFYCYEYLLRILPSVMSDYLRRLFMINGLAFGNLAAAYYYTYIPMQLPAGILIDRVSTRNVLSLACLSCAIGMYGFSSCNFYIAYLGRLLVGFGSTFAFVGITKLATIWFPPHYFGFIIGLTTSLGMLGAMLGNFMLVNLINSLGIDRLIKSTILFGMGLALLMRGIIADKPTKLPKIPSKPTTLDSYYAEGLALLSDPQLWLLGTIGSCLFLSLTAFSETWAIPYLIEHYQLSQQSAAYYNSLVFLGWAIGSPSMGYLASQFKANHLPRVIALHALLAAIDFSLMLYCSSFIKPYLGILLFLLGLFSSVQIMVFTIVRNHYESKLSGMAFAVTNLIVMLGGGLSQPLIGYLLDRFSAFSSADRLVYFSSSSFVYALTLLPMAFIMSTLLSYFIRLES